MTWNILRILYDNVSINAIKDEIMSSSNIESSYDDNDDDLSSSDEDGHKAIKTEQLGDFYFGDTEVDPLGAELDQFDCIGIQLDSKTVEEDNNWVIPAESITLRHEITYQPIVDQNYMPELSPVAKILGNRLKLLEINYLLL